MWCIICFRCNSSGSSSILQSIHSPSFPSTPRFSAPFVNCMALCCIRIMFWLSVTSISQTPPSTCAVVSSLWPDLAFDLDRNRLQGGEGTELTHTHTECRAATCLHAILYLLMCVLFPLFSSMPLCALVQHARLPLPSWLVVESLVPPSIRGSSDSVAPCGG